MKGLGALSVVLAVTSLTSGFSIYRDRIPNGRAVPHPCKPNYLWHGVGHENALGGGARNAFGLDFLRLGATWNAALCQLDSDGDGMTNGQELGDPQCIWTEGSLPSRISGITHPGVCDPWNDARCTGANTWVQCDVTELQCDALNEEGMQNVTFRFPSTPVPNTETNYYCMTFDLPGDEEYHLVATEPYIDNVQVMHHILVYGCDSDDEDDEPPSIPTPIACGMEAGRGCNSIIGLWTVGFAGTCLSNMTGFKFGKGHFTRVKLEFHWNNPELRSDYTDSSGMTMYFTRNLRPTSAATLMVGQTSIEIPPLQPAVEVTGSCSGSCSEKIFVKPFYIIAAINHMHYLGIKQKVELYRNGSFLTYITNEEAYSYDSPFVLTHDPPIEVLPGDEIRTTCTFNSATRSTVTNYGDGTSEEMCFAFMTVYPRDALPHTTACVSHKTYDVCDWIKSTQTCDFAKFGDTDDPWVQNFGRSVYASCTPFAACRPECLAVWTELQKDPCFRGDDLEILKQNFLTSQEGTYIMAALSSCWDRPQCPTCQECPTTAAPNNNNNVNINNNGNSNNFNAPPSDDAVSVLPSLVSMATMLVLSVAFKRL